MNNHVWGVSPATYSGINFTTPHTRRLTHVLSYVANKKLSEFFTVISTNVDRKGNTFLSTIEGK